MQKRNSKEILPANEPRDQDIASLAHSFFETEGRRNGHDVEHWLRARNQLFNDPVTGNKANGNLEPKAADRKRRKS